MSSEREEIEGIKIVNGPTRAALNEVKLVDYQDYKTQLIEWLVNEGKNPDRAEGYAQSTVRQVSQKSDCFYRWLWTERERYTTEISTEDASEYMDQLVYDDEDYSNSHMASVQKCLKRIFKWRQYQKGNDEDWDPDRTFSESPTQAPDYLTLDERKKIREAALDYGSVPSYKGVSPEEREQWRIHLAQRFGKAKADISPDDWKRANGWKIRDP